MKQMSIGMYYPVATYLHQLDGRVKVITMMMVMTVLFFSSNFWIYGLIFSCLLGLIVHARLPLKGFNGIASLRFIFVLTFFLSVFLVPGERILFEWHWIYGTVEGLRIGLVLVIRIILMLFTTTILTMTTTPFQLTSALAFLLSPLQKMGLPVAEGTLMVNLALRFVPTLMEEKDRIINAQKARGANFEEGGILKKAKSIIPVLIPLIISSFKRADDLALAMEARCFKIGKSRTNYRRLKMTHKDYKILLVILLLMLMMMALEIRLRSFL